MTVARAVLTRIRALPTGWRIILLSSAALALAGGLLAAREMRRELQARTRHGPFWNPAVPWQADVLTVFDAVADNTGIAGNRGNGMKLLVQTYHSIYYLTLEVAKDGTSSASLFAVWQSYDERPDSVIGPLRLAYSASETREFLTRFDSRLGHYWGIEGPTHQKLPRFMWERTVGGDRFGGQNVVLPGRTYGQASADVRRFLARRLGPAALPGPAWEWPAASGARPAALPPPSPRSAPR
jgi:hypothetical protein